MPADERAADGEAHYVFRVRFRLAPRARGVTVEPASFETVLRRRADPPGEDGWLFFRDNLWRGEVNDPAHLRDLLEETLSVTIESVTFSELQTDAAYLSALRDAVAADLDQFRADDVPAVLSKYLGSSVRVRD
ncbi:MAG: LWR-salt protein [Haloarculaceae archaeon]